ncbi:unnamed protein product [Mytilus coruscus]|uniref:Peptidase A2 domain-containing protein n=1 Tax=Mytilus coruscus TaxID=42192 RepID=A0A6J8AA83_MYTCO|nr:unnamed protein product [Mytilus coruscus]
MIIMRDQKQVYMYTKQSTFTYEYNHGQSTSNSYSEHRVNNVSDRNYNMQYEHPLTSITDDALTYGSKLPSEVRRSIKQTYELLERRYGYHLLPEQYREKLNQMRKEYKEPLTEYAAREADLVNKAFPGLNTPELLTTLTIENLLRGLPDQSLTYEETEEYTDVEVRKVNGGRPRFVTEERLKSRLGVFDKEIQHEIKDGHTQLRKRNDFKDDIGKLFSGINGNSPNKNAVNRKQNDSLKFSLKDTTCYTCQRKGYIRWNEDFNTNSVIDECIDNSFEIFDTDLYIAMVDVVIDKVRSVTLRAPLSIEGQMVKAVVDTSAKLTVMNRNNCNISSSTDGISNWVEIGKGISQGDMIEPPNNHDDLKCFKVSSLDTINDGVQANTP